MRRIAAALVLTVVLALAVSTTARGAVRSVLVGHSRFGQELVIAVRSSAYGELHLTTEPKARCTLRIDVEAGLFGDGPPSELDGTADAQGALVWDYPAPVVPPGQGVHHISCTYAGRSASADAPFVVGERAIEPRDFGVRLVPVDPLTQLPEVETRLEPSLVPARDAAVADLRARLPAAWTRATRGLGHLRIVEASSDLVVYVLPGRAISQHQIAIDGSRRVLLYTLDQAGRPWTDGGLTRALHELGHTWCCSGAGAGPDGHWLEQVPDPQLAGASRYGLMNDPINCHHTATVFACPTEFSSRELAQMGFSDVPAPMLDSCEARWTDLRAQVARLDTEIAASKVALEAERTELTGMDDELRSIEDRYRSATMPKDVHAQYLALLERYNAHVARFNAAAGAVNDEIRSRNDLAREAAELPC